MRRFLLVFLLVLFFDSAAFAAEYSVGVSPAIVDAGTIEPGSSKILRFYVVTISSDPLVVSLESDEGFLDFFTGKYRDYLLNYSEQRRKDWVTFLNNPVELLAPPSDFGVGIRGAREINFILSVPDDAEPGYHMFIVRPTPFVQKDDLGKGAASIVTLTPLPVLFKVPGRATRDGSIIDVNYEGNIITYFRNDGTVTMMAHATHRLVRNGAVYTAESQKDYVRPGETHKFAAPFSGPEGLYNISTLVDYTTGSSSFINEMRIRPKAPAAMAVSSQSEFPWWMVAVILILLVAIMVYRRSK
jgi:hypothetical protein